MLALIVAGGVAVIGLFVSLLFSERAPYFRLSGKRVLITGGSSGIGLATARSLLQNGCSVCILARNSERLKQAETELKPFVGKNAVLMTLSTDVSNPTDVQAAVDQTISKLGGIDALITSAGASRPGYFLQLPIAEFEQLMRVNYLGSVYAARAVIPHMKEQGGGRIIFVSSLAGQAGIFGYTAYSPSKFAVRGFAEALHMEFRHYNIYCSVVNPPDVDTPMLAEEAKFKPEECRLISEGSGLFKAEDIARDIVSGLQQWRFFIQTGLDGFLLGHLSAGFAPSSGTASNFFEIFFGGLLRLIALVYIRMYNGICTKTARQRDSSTKKTGEKRQ